MKSIIRSLKLLIIWLASIAFLLGAIAIGFRFCVTYPYYQIEIGMNENQVIEIFGNDSPIVDQGEKAFLCEIKVWYGDCMAVQNSGATYFLTFKLFFDTYAIVGLKDNRVIFKGLGDA
jgi:hypothetical protein